MANGLPDTLLDTGADQEAPGPDLRALLVRGLSRSLRWVIGLTAIGALAGLWFGVMQPNLYASNTKLLLRVGPREQITSETMIGAGSADEQRISGPSMFDEIQMLSDIAILERVARTIGPQEVLRPEDPARDDTAETPALVRLLHAYQRRSFGLATIDHECPGPTCTTCLRQATKELNQNASITNEFGSNVIAVSYVSTSPDKAQRITQALADAFIERHKEQFSTKVLVEQARPNVERAEREKNTAAQNYFDFVNRSSTAEVQPLSPTFAAEMNNLDDKLWDAKLRLSKVAGKRSALVDRSKSKAEKIAPTGPNLMIPNPDYEKLQEIKRGLVAQRTELPASDVTTAKELSAKITQIDEQLAGMSMTISQLAGRRSQVGGNASPGSAELQDDEHSLQLEIAALESRIAEKRAQAAEATKQNLSTEQERKMLAAERDAAADRYQALLDRFLKLEALSEIDANEGANLKVLQAPTLERDKVGPKRVSLLLKGLLAGLFAGSLFAVARQRLDTKLRYPELLESSVGLPVLGVVPQSNALRRLPRSSGKEAGSA